MSKVAFICDKNLAGLFEGLGMDAVLFDDKEDPRVALENLAAKGYRIIYILERIASNFIDTIDEVRKERNVSIVLVGDHISSLGLGMSLARLATIDAVGTDAVFVTEKEGNFI